MSLVRKERGKCVFREMKRYLTSTSHEIHWYEVRISLTLRSFYDILTFHISHYFCQNYVNISSWICKVVNKYFETIMFPYSSMAIIFFFFFSSFLCNSTFKIIFMFQICVLLQLHPPTLEEGAKVSSDRLPSLPSSTH